MEGDKSHGTCTRISKNHKSAIENPAKVYEKLAKESLLNRIAGPFKTPPLKNLVCSPLGLVPKNVPGKFRLIHDLSYPKGNSVNSLIPQENSTVKYDGIDTVIQLGKQFGRHCKLSKCDIEDAFRIIPIHPSDYYLLGFTWNNYFYFDRCLPMGASSSCQIFEKFSCAIQWIMQTKYHAAGMSHIIDDFLFVGPPNSDKSLHDLNSFLQLCNRIGIPIKAEKTVYPTTVITIYGIEIDSNKMECRLPVDKIVKIRNALNKTYNRKKIKLRDLQSLIGLLNFACLVVSPGRAFLRRLIDLTIKVFNPFHWIKLTCEARADILAWKCFIESFNGQSMFLPDHWVSSDHLRLYTDASGNVGYGAVFGSWWFANSWPKQLMSYSIAVKELFPIVIALEIWGPFIKNSKILFLSDNQAVVDIINKKSCKNKTLMILIRRLVLASMTWNVIFRSKHIKGKTNIVADLLSRSQFQKAHKVAPWLSPTPADIPVHLLKV